MKKRAKPKPKRRGSMPAQARVADKAAQAPIACAVPTQALAPQPTQRIASPQSNPRARIAVAPIPREDRTAFALLMLPFLVVALSLAMAQSRRASLSHLPEIAVGAAVERIAAAPRPAAPPAITPPTPTAVPMPPPAEIAAPPARQASLDVASPPVLPATPAPHQIEVPGPIPRFPPPMPHIEPPVAVAPPAAPAVEVAAEPASSIAVASLDVGLPPAPPAADTIARPAPPATGETVCAPSAEKLASFSVAGRLARAPRLTGVDAETFGRRLSAAALAQTEDLVIYTARYQAMAFPMGDVLAMHGACIDVVIRAYRTVGIDLQEEVQRARPSRGDPNIDHRRTENMRRFFERHGTSLPITEFPEDYKPGDVVTYYRPFSRISTSHIAIVTDVLGPSGRPMIVHNRGYGPQLEDALFVDRVTGHYRYMGQPSATVAPKAAEAGKSVPVVRASLPR